MGKFYTGIGSRHTPSTIIATMTSIAKLLSDLGWTLRSGGASGADTAFQLGASAANIYRTGDSTIESMAIAARFHPAWHRCSSYARQLHGRNTFQVLGLNLKTPSSFLICWTRDSCISHSTRSIQTGGTGTAISIANHYNIPIFNLARPDHLTRLVNFVRIP